MSFWDALNSGMSMVGKGLIIQKLVDDLRYESMSSQMEMMDDFIRHWKDEDEDIIRGFSHALSKKVTEDGYEDSMGALLALMAKYGVEELLQ